MAPTAAEAGVRRNETFYVREITNADGTPQTPSDPNWEMYSTVIQTSEVEPGSEFETRSGLGNVDPVDKNHQQESHELTVTYDLEQFPVDSNGDPQDAFADAVKRDIDNQLSNTHSFLQRELKQQILAENTVHNKYITEDGNPHPSGSDPGATQKDTRNVTYAFGGFPTEPSLMVDPGESAVVQVELPYTFRKLRTYQIDQPETSGVTLAARSTDSADTSLTLEVESVGATTTESLSLDSSDATTLVESSSSYDDLRCVDISDASSDPAGNIEVYVYNSTDSVAEQLLTVIPGKSAYDGIEADEGVPALGAGSFADGSNLGDAQVALGRQLDWDGHVAAEKVMSTTLTVTNNIEDSETSEGLSLDLRAGPRNIEQESTVFGETESHDKLSAHLEGIEGETRLYLQGGDVVLPRAFVSDGGSASREADQALLTTGATFTALQPDDGSDAIQFVTS